MNLLHVAVDKGRLSLLITILHMGWWGALAKEKVPDSSLSEHKGKSPVTQSYTWAGGGPWLRKKSQTQVLVNIKVSPSHTILHMDWWAGLAKEKVPDSSLKVSIR